MADCLPSVLTRDADCAAPGPPCRPRVRVGPASMAQRGCQLASLASGMEGFSLGIGDGRQFESRHADGWASVATYG